MIEMKSVAKPELFRELPSVDEVVRHPALTTLIAAHGQSAITEAARLVLSGIRNEISSGLLDRAALHLRARKFKRRDSKTSCAIAVLFTSFGHQRDRSNSAYESGESSLAQAALSHLAETAGGYSNLEFDVEAGERGKRDVHVDRLFQNCWPTWMRDRSPTSRDPAQAISTIVVNNNAAAVLLALNTLADGGEVIVSRGELVEIGGSFRIPDVMAKSGAVLREVGTTNRTRISDYEIVIGDRTRVLLRVHRSNFEMKGLRSGQQSATSWSLPERKTFRLWKIWVVERSSIYTIRVRGEDGVVDSLRAGVDVVTYSGDKLLGGPRSGIADWPCRSDRAVRKELPLPRLTG